MNSPADPPHHVGLTGLSVLLEKMLKLRRGIKMIFNRIFSPASDDNYIFNPGSNALLDGILNQRFIDHRQHFFRLRFGSGQKAGSQTRSRQNSLANFSDRWTHVSPAIFSATPHDTVRCSTLSNGDAQAVRG